MKKNATVFFCQECGYESAKWLGQCPACHEWNTFAEEPKAPSSRGRSTGRSSGKEGRKEPVLLKHIDSDSSPEFLQAWQSLIRCWEEALCQDPWYW